LQHEEKQTADEVPGTEEGVATGDRREEMRYEDDPAQLARIRHTLQSDANRLPKQMTASGDHEPPSEAGPLTDVAEAAPSSSVWDARPNAD
jgi:hypothetical protein